MIKTVLQISNPRAMAAIVRIEEFVEKHAKGWDVKNLADDLDIIRSAIPDGGGLPAIKEFERVKQQIGELQDKIDEARAVLR